MWWAGQYRLIYALLLSLIISSVQSQILLGIGLIIVFITLLLLHFRANISPLAWLKRSIRFNLFSLLLFLTLSWQITPQGVQWYAQGITLASLISLRMNVIMLSLQLCLWQMRETDLVRAVSKLPLPEKLIGLFVLTLRYIQLLQSQRQKMELAMQARGYQARLNWRTLQLNAQKVAWLLVHALLKAERSEQALKSRGFQFGKKEQHNE